MEDTADYRPPKKILVAVDPVVFTIRHEALHVLLIKRRWPPYKGTYALPGGFVKEQEDLDVSVKRELSEETGVKDIFMKRANLYDAVKRDPRGRVIAVSFLALIRGDQRLKARTDAVEAKWYPVDDVPKLAFEHDQIIKDALTMLKFEIQTTNIALQILPKRFTLSAMQMLYEMVLGKELDKRNFRKRLKELDIVKGTGEKFREGAHRPAELFEFKDQTYQAIGKKVNVFL